MALEFAQGTQSPLPAEAGEHAFLSLPALSYGFCCSAGRQGMESLNLYLVNSHPLHFSTVEGNVDDDAQTQNPGLGYVSWGCLGRSVKKVC